MAINELGKSIKSMPCWVTDAVKEVNLSELIKDQSKPGEPPVTNISVYNALKVIYFLMAADGHVYHDEEEKFDAIASSLDPEFAAHKEQLVGECQSFMENITDTDDLYGVLQDGMEESLISPDNNNDSFVTPKLLVWDLLGIAYSDEKYDEAERRLIEYVVWKLDVDKAVFAEMESTYITLTELENELWWIKNTDRPYLQIEAMVKEIENRKKVISKSVEDLITL